MCIKFLVRYYCEHEDIEYAPCATARNRTTEDGKYVNIKGAIICTSATTSTPRPRNWIRNCEILHPKSGTKSTSSFELKPRIRIIESIPSPCLTHAPGVTPTCTNQHQPQPYFHTEPTTKRKPPHPPNQPAMCRRIQNTFVYCSTEARKKTGHNGTYTTFKQCDIAKAKSEPDNKLYVRHPYDNKIYCLNDFYGKHTGFNDIDAFCPACDAVEWDKMPKMPYSG
ncbi:hypothetical protein BDV95DRAFT_594955 [Massariosphaeria phaeospora]|uniref:Uncharacterized protein n=1 Tax=Massariosphaeria phaeospora TaxID=100035 RepID=A0A7C8MNB7_9PLEO|nr:hypothetical protein BDV95DRAFT_594955 [Massariosphaeria phaeospora]